MFALALKPGLEFVLEPESGMAVAFHESSVAPEALTPGVSRQRLLADERIARTKVLLDRLVLSAGASIEVRVGPHSLAWLHILEGDALMQHGDSAQALCDAHIVFVPSTFAGTLATRTGATVLYAELPNADALESDAPDREMRVIDWTREPVLDSQHDARKRIYVMTPKLFGTRAVKGEMIIYPPGTAASRHHHEGAEHFMYMLAGRGTAYAGEQPIPVRKGDVIYYGERESHYLRSEGDEDMVFVEYFVPGVYTTVWAEGAPVCTWAPSGRDIRGGRPVRDIEGHRSGIATPQDV